MKMEKIVERMNIINVIYGNCSYIIVLASSIRFILSKIRLLEHLLYSLKHVKVYFRLPQMALFWILF